MSILQLPIHKIPGRIWCVFGVCLGVCMCFVCRTCVPMSEKERECERVSSTNLER